MLVVDDDDDANDDKDDDDKDDDDDDDDDEDVVVAVAVGCLPMLCGSRLDLESGSYVPTMRDLWERVVVDFELIGCQLASCLGW